MRKLFAVLLCAALLCAAALAETAAPSVTGTVIEVEKYGHALLDITIADFEAAGFTLGDVVTVTAGTYEGDMPYFNGYYVERGDYMLRAYPGHTNIAVCINYGKFAETAGIGVGDPVTITLKEPAGALALQVINNLVYTQDRADYASDEIFANFRPVTAGNIAAGTLYRSASPVNNSHGRAAIACALMEQAGIRAVADLADTEEELAECFAAEGFASDAYKALYEEGGVIALGLPADFSAEDFNLGLVRGLTFLAEHEGPWLIHCNEGKDRAGFTAMVIEALMGASVEEITADYMESYVDYYGVEPGTVRYEIILQTNLAEMLKELTGTPNPADADLQAAAEAYLLRYGMARETIDALKLRLSGGNAAEDAA